MKKLILVILLLASPAFATDYYVATTGNDSNSGLVDAPFLTIQKAADVVVAGDTVTVKDGTYTDTNSDNRVVYLNKAGTSGSWITFKAENKWGAKLNGQTNTTSICWAFGSAAQYVRIEDFEVYGCKDAGFHTQDADYGYLYRNNVHDIGRYCSSNPYGQPGIFTGTGATHWTFDSNVIHNNGRYQVGESGCLEATCNTDLDRCGMLDPGMYLNGPYADVMNNVFYENNASNHLAIKSSYCTGCGSHYNVINNTFGQSTYKYDATLELVACDSGYSSYSDDIVIKNNLFRTGRSWDIMFWCPERMTNVVIKNNMTQDDYLFWPYGVAAWGWDITTDTDFTLSSNTEDSVQSFTDYAGYDFTLKADSPAINAGIVTTVTTDAAGNTRVGNPDIGAYEYGSSADTTAPTVPASLTGTATGQTTVTLSWAASTDADPGMGYYKVYRDTVTPEVADYVGRTTSTEVSYNDTGLTSNTHYHYKISAVDQVGNESALSSEFTITTKENSNILLNGSFEDGTTEPTSWSKYSDGTMSWAFGTGNSSSKSIDLTITAAGTNVQMNQTGVSLADTATYRLSFDAKSSTGNDVAVSIFKNTSPYTNYGLVSTEKNLTTGWQTFTVDFTANATVSDGRLMFWLAPYDANGDVYSFDNVYLEQITPGDTTPPSQPTSVTATVVSSSRIDLAWTASTDNVAVTGYKVFIDAVDSGNVGTNESSETGLAANTSYAFTVKAYDAQGNMSAASDSVSATTYKEQTSYTAYKTAETITVNGSCDEYASSNVMTVGNLPVPLISGSIKIRWDTLHLHICATITDSYVNESITTEDADYTVGDSLYLYLRRGSSTYTFAVGAEGGANAKRDELDLDPEQDYTLVFDTTVTASVGYVVELAIPWSEIGDAPAESSTESLDIVLYDYTDGTTVSSAPWNNTDHGVVTDYAGFGSITYGPLPATVNMPTGGKATQMIGDL